MHRILFPSRHTKCAHLTSISLPRILSRIRSCSSRLISVISDRHGRASAIIVLRKRDRERGTESIKAVGTTAFLPLPPAKGKQSLHIAFLHIFHSDWRWGDCPFVPPLDARFFRLEQAAWRATAVRLRRRGYAYPGGIAENGLIIMAGVVTPACFRRRGGVCTRDTTPKYIHAPRHPVRKIFSVSNSPSPRTSILEQTEQTTP